jgi:hypothetical protein
MIWFIRVRKCVSPGEFVLRASDLHFEEGTCTQEKSIVHGYKGQWGLIRSCVNRLFVDPQMGGMASTCYGALYSKGSRLSREQYRTR